MRDDAIQIGEWSFFPHAGELRRGDRRSALEDRAARLLAVLARERGNVVSQEQLVSEVWGGRSLSANSVAVVIGDLRRALGDDARSPKYIETIAKRGYRLAPELSAAPAPSRRRLFMAAAGLGGLALAGLAYGFALRPDQIAVSIAEVSNETGDERYAPLARAVGELVVNNASRAEALRVSRGSDATADLLVSSRLILWSGHPSVSISATDARSGEVIWSGIAPGPEDSLPSQVREQMALLASELEARAN